MKQTTIEIRVKIEKQAYDTLYISDILEKVGITYEEWDKKSLEEKEYIVNQYVSYSDVEYMDSDTCVDDYKVFIDET
jgi:hypothetical protein